MKVINVLGLLFFFMVAPVAHSIEPSKMVGYTLTWSDEFDGDSIDRAAWNIEHNGSGCGNRELQFYVDDSANVDVKNGNLILTALKKDFEGKNFTSGRINTCGKVRFTYGIIEAKIKIPPTANGLWPAFWMMGDDITNNGWPFCGEIDILEMGHSNGIESDNQDKLFNGALHWGNPADGHKQLVGDRVNDYSLQDDHYHVFYTVWTPEKIEMYIDDNPKPYLTVDISDDTNKSSVGYYFHKPNFILFNLAVGGGFPSLYDADKITGLDDGRASMVVDYVRVYQKENTVLLN